MYQNNRISNWTFWTRIKKEYYEISDTIKKAKMQKFHIYKKEFKNTVNTVILKRNFRHFGQQ